MMININGNATGAVNHGRLRGTIGYNSAVISAEETQGKPLVVTSKVGSTTATVLEPQDGYCSGSLERGSVSAPVSLEIQEINSGGSKFRNVQGKVANVDVSVVETYYPSGRWIAEGKVGSSFMEAVFLEQDGKLEIQGRIWPHQPTAIPTPGNSPVPFQLTGNDGSDQDFPFESVIPALLLVTPQ